MDPEESAESSNVQVLARLSAWPDPDCFSEISEVFEFLFISGASCATPHHVYQRGITCVINCTVEVPTLRLKGVETIKIEVNDTPFSIIFDYFDSCAERIEYHRQQGTVISQNYTNDRPRTVV